MPHSFGTEEEEGGDDEYGGREYDDKVKDG
jgi:hypothetical protein